MLRKNKDGQKINLKKVFPFFIIYFVLASIITTVAIKMGVSADFFTPFKELSNFFIVLAMVAIGINRFYLLDMYCLYEFIHATSSWNMVKSS